MIYPVITLYQPWATWIMRKWKTIETRTHARFACLNQKTILIHAGLTFDHTAMVNPYLTMEQILQDPNEMLNGYILGSVHVDACGWLCGDQCENEAALIECTDRYGLFLKQITPFEKKIPVKGEMGIWYFDTDAMRKIKKPKPEQKQFSLPIK